MRISHVETSFVFSVTQIIHIGPGVNQVGSPYTLVSDPGCLDDAVHLADDTNEVVNHEYRGPLNK